MPSIASAPILTADFCEREYNARVAVPQFQDYFRNWAARSQMAREKLAHYADLAYGPGPLQTVDLFTCDNPRGLLVFIHGGYWRSLDKSDFSMIAAPFVSAGIAVATVNYPLCPAANIRNIIADCEHALVWLLRAAPRFGMKGVPVVLSGHSAGAHLAVSLGASDWPALGIDSAQIIGIVALSGIYDLAPLQHTTMNADLHLDEVSVRALSPVHRQPNIAVPVHLLCGALESSEFQRQGQLLHTAWPAHTVAPQVVSGRHHFSIVDELCQPEGAAFRAAMTLLTQ